MLPPNAMELPIADVADKAPLPVVTKLNKCEACNNLDPRGHAQTRTVSINGNQIPTLQLGPGFPAKDCGYCDLLFHVVKEFYPFSDDSKYERTWKNPTLAILLAEHHPISLWVPVVNGRGIQHCGWVDIYALSDIPVIPSIGKASSFSESSDSRSCFTFIQNCLLDCRQHAGCKISHSSAPPRRLLYLEGPSNSSELQSHQRPKIKLCETHGQLYRYATLSHCWGSTQIIATKKANVRKFEDAIHWYLLPKTFQDAIITALRLEIRYLWIDSLCIIQDDKTDWDTEAARMGDIYQNSYLTIAATSSPSGAFPFLGPRPPNYKPKTLQFPNPQRLSNTINNQTVCGSADDINALRIRQGPPIHRINLSELSRPRIYGPLTTRGWALQERVLSSRIVHFTDEGIIWECRMSIQSEDQRRMFPGHVQKWSNFSNIAGKNQPILLHPNRFGNDLTTLALYICPSPHEGTLILLFRS
jgi:Heterokaryon incompatibility protein (HET)